MEAQNQNTTARYNDSDLEEFRVLVEGKLETAVQELAYLQEQILEITENSGDDHGGDWMDDSSTNNDIEFLNNMAIRQRKYIQDLENALIRIKNKTYGICLVTGHLIEKRRLLAVPTATKSVEAKAAEAVEVPKKVIEKAPISLEQAEKKEKAISSTPKIITKVIRKPTKPVKPVNVEEDDDLDFDFDKEYAYDGGGTDDAADDDYEKGGMEEKHDSFDDGGNYEDIPDDSGSDDDY
ncbi:MAG: TraR/DksA family transcriptional regulator [Saprospiraceae bacterium]|jgi:RNA polymerase-binding transcription factor DksA|nr:TraR/DksA family transcriptional regulator [Saprospiraceae bacterium]